MNSEILDKLDEITDIISRSKALERMKILKNILDSDQILLEKIKKVQSSNYDNEYIVLKKEILDNEAFAEYRSIEKELYMLIQSINVKLKELTKE